MKEDPFEMTARMLAYIVKVGSAYDPEYLSLNKSESRQKKPRVHIYFRKFKGVGFFRSVFA